MEAIEFVLSGHIPFYQHDNVRLVSKLFLTLSERASPGRLRKIIEEKKRMNDCILYIDGIMETYRYPVHTKTAIYVMKDIMQRGATSSCQRENNLYTKLHRFNRVLNDLLPPSYARQFTVNIDNVNYWFSGDEVIQALFGTSTSHKQNHHTAQPRLQRKYLQYIAGFADKLFPPITSARLNIIRTELKPAVDVLLEFKSIVWEQVLQISRTRHPNTTDVVCYWGIDWETDILYRYLRPAMGCEEMFNAAIALRNHIVTNHIFELDMDIMSDVFAKQASAIERAFEIDDLDATGFQALVKAYKVLQYHVMRVRSFMEQNPQEVHFTVARKKVIMMDDSEASIDIIFDN